MATHRASLKAKTAQVKMNKNRSVIFAINMMHTGPFRMIKHLINLKSVPDEFWWRSLSYLLSALLLPNITLVMFLIYMAEHNFFSYDFISEGIFGMKLFFLTTTAMLIVTSLSLFNPVLIIVARKKHKKLHWGFVVAGILLSAISWLVVAINIIQSENLTRILFLIGICVALIVHMSVLAFCMARQQLISLGATSFFVIYLSLMNPTQAAQAMSTGLRVYGSGGDLPITIYSSNSGAVTSGKLLLITPNTIRFIPDDNSGVATYLLSNVSHYVVGTKNDAESTAQKQGASKQKVYRYQLEPTKRAPQRDPMAEDHASPG